jgi:beta-N-acetylhexosaminidase
VRGAFAAGLVLVALFSCGCGGDEHHGRASAKPDDSASALPLDVAVGQLLIVSFDGTTPPPWVRRWLRRGQAAGVILFGGNAPDAATTKRVTVTLQRAAHGGALVSTDQEGGPVKSLEFASPDLGQGSLGTPDAVMASVRATVQGLHAVGVNVNLAPVADVIRPGTALAGRGYPGGSAQVASLVGYAVQEYRGSKVAATVKHFPGLGRAVDNTDDKGVTVPAPRGQLDTDDLTPFDVAVGARVPLVMASHALYPALDPDHIASQSPAILENLLRRKMRFRGVVVTDSLEAQAVLERSNIAQAAERSVAAGVDLVLMTGSGSWREVYPRLLRHARSDPRFAARVRESASRVLALKKSLGLRQPR